MNYSDFTTAVWANSMKIENRDDLLCQTFGVKCTQDAKYKFNKHLSLNSFIKKCQYKKLGYQNHV